MHSEVTNQAIVFIIKQMMVMLPLLFAKVEYYRVVLNEQVVDD